MSTNRQVQGLAMMLGERAGERLGADDRQLLELQQQAALGMLDTLDALTALARSTLQPMPRQPLDLSALVHEVLAQWPQLRASVQPDMAVQADPAALKIVLANLLGNAAKFTRDCAEPCVRISLHDAGAGRVGVRVEDNGVGFDPARAAELFRPFSRLHSRENYAGSGIGLSIVQRIVERHGGSVAATSLPGQGACFEFTLDAVAPVDEISTDPVPLDGIPGVHAARASA
jgi:signal transduction histidine kinase